MGLLNGPIQTDVDVTVVFDKDNIIQVAFIILILAMLIFLGQRVINAIV